MPSPLKLSSATHVSAPDYATLIRASGEPLVILNEQGLVVEASEGSSQLFGKPVSAMLDRDFDGLLKPVTGDELRAARLRKFKTGDFSHDGVFEDFGFENARGETRVVDVRRSTVALQKTSYVVMTFRDVTEKKRLELELLSKHQEMTRLISDLEKSHAELKSTQDMLVQSSKLAALGELTSGIAHEINQPLQIILGFSQEARRSKDPAVLTDAVNEISSQAEKVALIIKHLRALARKTLEDHTWVDVHTVVGDALEHLLEPLKTEGITVQQNLDAPDARVFGSAIQLEQIFANLVTNARDAILETKRGKGTIAITSKNHKDFLEVEVTDDGAGIPESVRSKIFNPFFTTKEVGKGMGLGLSLSYGILNQHHGSIVVESTAGRGTSFRIRLPKDFRNF